MPTYVYKCNSCKKVIEIVRAMTDIGPKVCQDCSGDLVQLITASNFVLKGSGWYRDGYESKTSE